MKTYLSAPAALRSKIEELIDKIKSEITQEVEDSFTKILSTHPNLHIYSLGLYYSAGSWGYIMPTFSSEEGLVEISKHYIRHYEVDLETQKAALRWSPCDSPHHSDNELESMMPITNELLQELSEIMHSTDPDFDEYEWHKSFLEDHNLVYKFISEVHSLILTAVIDGINRVRKNPRLSAHFASNDSALTLDAGDLGQDKFLSHIKRLNTPEVYKKITNEIEKSNLANEAISKRLEEKRKEDLENPPTTNLTVEDFQEIIDAFNPTFKEVDGGIFLDKEDKYVLEGTSGCEESFNRIEPMELLERSPHFLEIDKLFGHFIGPQFKPDDLLPNLWRAFVQKLGMALIKKYKDKTFRVYMSVDRLSRYLITFVVHRNDGYEFFLPAEELKSGVVEIHEFSAKGDLLTVAEENTK